MKVMAIAAAALAGFGAAPSVQLNHNFRAPISIGYGGRSINRTGRGFSGKNAQARQAGIPKAFRQHARRYHSDIHTLLQTHRQFPAPMLDHWRDRIRAFNRAVALMQDLR